MLGLIQQEEIAFHGLRTGGAAECLDEVALLFAVEQLAGLQALQLIGELGAVLELGHLKLARGVIHISEPDFLPLAKYGGEVVGAI